MITRVRHMKEYRNINRLQSNQFVGENHIRVRQQFTVNYPQHWHNYFEVELVLSGSAKHTYNGKEYTIQKADAYLLTPVDFHGMESPDRVELLNISFDDVCVPSGMLSLLSAPETERLYKLDEAEFERFYMGAQLLQYECQTGGPCANQLLEYLLSSLLRRKSANRDQIVDSEQLEGIKKAISYVELHFREHISLAQLAAISGYNPSYFSELFRKVTGQTYKERLQQLRISYAKMLLANGISVSDACFASGFGSLSNFSASFRKHCGQSPNNYRRTSGL